MPGADKPILRGFDSIIAICSKGKLQWSNPAGAYPYLIDLQLAVDELQETITNAMYNHQEERTEDYGKQDKKRSRS